MHRLTPPPTAFRTTAGAGAPGRRATPIQPVWLLWCGEAICQTRTASGAPQRYHYPQGELRGSQRLYYARDHLGSVREVRDLATGLTVAAFDYTPYGALRVQNASLTPDRGFAGMWRHPTGLYLTHYRAYSPAYGRWITRDPIEEAGGVNLYAYVGNSPINYVDPLGLEPYKEYPSSKAAGEQAVRDINPTSIQNGVEYAGKLCTYVNGSCFYTLPNKGGKDWSYDGSCPADTASAGNYHTHGNYDKRYDNENFSDDDRRILDKDNLPGVLGTPQGMIKIYTPKPDSPLSGTIQTIGSGAK